ncbi:MAG TPA: FAD-binding oxidoreductase [Streptosporangiaceae bacterium]|jgi:glycolate oxidase FAD binding subunit|nr:FAD-binding oxidoreductase [Streptosporangiaceae bacterium]
MTDEAVLRELAAACPAARAAGDADAVAGVVPRFAASPASVAEASALLRAAAGHELSVVARGGGSRLDWGAPPRRCDLVVGTSRLDQVLEHAAGDLVARVQAGLSLHKLGEVLAAAGQQLALDEAPGGNGQRPAATIGGTLATGMAGPRRLRYGTPRDLVIGITVVRADGTVASSGGKVVKNVAGYDLGKLFAGSYGTLGLIVEAAFRLHPLPAAASYTTVDTDGPAAARAAVAAAAASELAPVAVEISRAARDQPVRVGVLLEGDPGGVAERAAVLRGLLGDGAASSGEAPGWWGRLEPPAGPGTLVRVAFWAAALPRVLAAIDAAAAAVPADPQVAGSAASGVLYAALPASTGPAAAAGFVAGLREALARGDADARPASAPLPDSPPVLASAVVVHAPPAVRKLVDLWGPVPGLSLMRAVKDQFDPGHRMAPGRFAGGI